MADKKRGHRKILMKWSRTKASRVGIDGPRRRLLGSAVALSLGSMGAGIEAWHEVIAEHGKRSHAVAECTGRDRQCVFAGAVQVEAHGLHRMANEKAAVETLYGDGE
ncbi:MAG: hypothetical protein ACRERV_01410 [Methylococcales bacterium]